MVGQTFDPEKFQLNLVRYKRHGSVFEVVVNPDEAIAYRNGGAVDINAVLKSQHIFADAQKGLQASKHTFMPVFETDDEDVIVQKILKDGEIQLTSLYKNQLREQKKKQVITQIAKFGVDPRTKAPHTHATIESAVAQSKVKFDEFKAASDQVQTVLKALQPIIPISFEEKEIKIIIPKQFASKTVNLLKSYGTVKHQTWLADGSVSTILLVPGGLERELYDRLNAATHGQVMSELLSVQKQQTG
ncbi:MAG TPA: ribosome assembly factor SBDS [Acidobacteriota bacterium]|nr:ribosome assembly factor SBDS [Acidobacteriota bacterium]